MTHTNPDSEINFDTLEALCEMYDQYCSGTYGHEFMGAGEHAIEILDKYGLAKDDFHIADDWETRLAELQKEFKDNK